MRHNSFSPLGQKQPSKYRNKKVVLDGETFDSMKEANRYAKLKLMEKAGLIAGLRRQVQFELVPSVKIAGSKRASPAIRYTADFAYAENGVHIVEDCKGFLTRDYKLRRHLMKALLGIDIKET